MPGSTSKGAALTAASILGLLLLWQAAATAVGREIVLPGPVAAGRALLALGGRRDFWAHVGATLARGAAGFILSYLAGLVAGLAGGLNRVFDSLFRPLLVGIRSTPSMALILLALIWFPSNLVAVFVTFFVVFPLVAQNTADGVRSVDPALLEMARVYRVRRARIFRRLYLPAIAPYLAAGATAGLGITWKVTIAAEVMAGPRWGMGTRMDTARVFLETPEVFAWTAAVVAIGLFFDYALDLLVRERLLAWR